MSFPISIAGLMFWIALMACVGTREPHPHPPTAATGACNEDERAAVREALARVGEIIRASEFGQDATSINSALAVALKSPCLRPAAENPRPVTFVARLQAAVWWDAGGRKWLESLVPSRLEATTVVVPPDVLPVVMASAARQDERPKLVCVERPETCGAEVAAWRLRATEYWAHGATDLPPTACTDALTVRDGYRAWRTCVELERRLEPAFPIGTLRAPDRGWLRMRAHVRHDRAICDELRLYDVETGAFAVASTCRVAGGQSGEPSVIRGTIPVGLVREAVWMTLMAPEVLSGVQIIAQRVAVPRSIARVLDGPVESAPVIVLDRMEVAGTEPIEWAWVDASRELAHGVMWPDSLLAGERYAQQLWNIADTARLETCPPRMPPAELPLEPEDALAHAMRVMRPGECKQP